jgi:hypothetical protein
MSKLQLAMIEKLKMASFFADDSARPLGDRTNLAPVGREQGQDAIGLAEIGMFENDSIG